jgi:site-specific DNA-methyltransferase (adenine-specific)
MQHTNAFFRAIGINLDDRFAVKRLSQATGIPAERLIHYNSRNAVPSGSDLDMICSVTGTSAIELTLKMGILDRRIIAAIQRHSGEVFDIIRGDLKNTLPNPVETAPPPLVFETPLGQLYQGDCLDLMHTMRSDSIDLIFADPPFNLKKLYPSGISDNLGDAHYLHWCERWAEQCVRLLKPGGSLFLWNIPKWNSSMSEYLNKRLTFRHWISMDIKYSLPIPGRLYPSHYSLL